MTPSASETRSGLRRPELLASLSLAIDLGLGQPMEHMLRSCLIAIRLAEAVGLDTVQRSLIGDVFRATSRHVPPPTGLRPVFEWGTEERLRELFGGAVGSLHTERTRLPFRFYSAAHAVDYFRAWYGPTQNAFNALDEAGQKSLREDLMAVWENHDVAKDGSLVAFSDYLQVVGVRT